MRIIHFVLSESQEENLKYLCNQACTITPKKATFNEDRVTCKNCLRALKKKNG